MGRQYEPIFSLKTVVMLYWTRVFHRIRHCACTVCLQKNLQKNLPFFRQREVKKECISRHIKNPHVFSFPTNPTPTDYLTEKRLNQNKVDAKKEGKKKRAS